MTGTLLRSRSKLNHSRINRRNVACPTSVNAAGRLISTADISTLEDSELHVRSVEAPALGNHAQNLLPYPNPAPAQELIQHDQDRGRAGIAARVEVREPLLLRNARAAHFEHVEDLAAEVV